MASMLLLLLACAASECVKDWRYVDADGDGYGTGELHVLCVEDGAEEVGDCDDTRADVAPNIIESCNEIDDNCDGDVDVGAIDAPTTYADRDRDGYGDVDARAADCIPPEGNVTVPGDCNDNNSKRFPGATEYCNDADDDCNGAIDDDALLAPRVYHDVDGDGFGDADDSKTACDTSPMWVSDDDDCDDTDSTIHPHADERCDGIDNDCDGTIDLLPDIGPSWPVDLDGDGYGSTTVTLIACIKPDGSPFNATDCNDGDPAVNPGVRERCDFGAEDEDCDGLVDDDDPDLVSRETWFADVDADGAGDPDDSVEAACPPDGWVATGDDCDDTDADVHPYATERCTERLDRNCDGRVGTEDADGDGVVACEDCDDGDAEVHPGATETLDGKDDDCDGLTDTFVGDVLITTEVEAAAFCATYHAIDGSLEVSDVPSLRDLSCLEAVTGDLVFSSVAATDLHGLDALTTVGGDLVIGGEADTHPDVAASAFRSLAGLERLRSVGGSLYIVDNGIASLDPLEALETVGGSVVLSALPLVDVSLPMSTIGGDLTLTFLPEITTFGAPRLVGFSGDITLDTLSETSGSITMDWTTALPGVLRISRLPEATLVDLALPAEIGGLEVNNNGVRSISGLDAVERTTGDVLFNDNPFFVDADPLLNLTSVGGALTIRSHPTPTDWSAFHALTTVGGTLTIGSLATSRISGFDALTSIGGDLVIGACGSLDTISGFGAVSAVQRVLITGLPLLTAVPQMPSLRTVAGLQLETLPKLGDLSGLQGVEDVTGDVWLLYLGELVDLGGLSQVAQIGGDLLIRENEKLIDLDLTALQTVGGDLEISGNTALPAATAESLAARITVGGTTTIRDND